MSTVWGFASSASRYSGNVSQSHVSPSASAVPGMSSTPSSSPMSQSWRSARAGAKPDAAVAHRDRGDAVQRRRRDDRVPGDLAVEVGVDVDEAGGDERAVGVDLAVRRARRPSPTAVMMPSGDRDVARTRRGAPVPSTTCRCGSRDQPSRQPRAPRGLGITVASRARLESPSLLCARRRNGGTMTYRVIQWATGMVGQEAIRGVVAHPELELVGVWVHSDGQGRARRRASSAVSIRSASPRRTTSTRLLALDADCVVYAPVLASTTTVIRLLESGLERRDAGRAGSTPASHRRSRRSRTRAGAGTRRCTAPASTRAASPSGCRCCCRRGAATSATCAPRSSPTSATTRPRRWCATS